MFENEKFNLKEFLISTFWALVVLFIFWMFMTIGSIYEDHVRCQNGAVEYCTTK